jgi:hypothetical protein
MFNLARYHGVISPGPLEIVDCPVRPEAADPSLFVTPQAEYNIASNIYIGAGSFIGIGKGPTAVQGELPFVLRSEFGSYPNIYFGSFRYYF